MKLNNIATLLKYPLNEIKNMKSNEIEIEVEVKEEDIGKEIYFLSKIIGFNNIGVNEEIDESNTEIYINNKKAEFKKYFIPNKEGIYLIKLKLNFDFKNCYCMFEGCENIKAIDLSSFKTKNVTNMSYIFCGCHNLKSIDLTSFDTKNVNNMSYMFRFCTNLEFVNLSSFDT